MERTVLLKIAYDGTGFCGWQRQPGKRTVCGELESALERVTGMPIKIDGTSRTDAGVHALGQQASFRADCPVPTDRLARALSDVLAKDRLEHVGDISVLEAKDMPDDFHARYSSVGKRYIYVIRNAAQPDLFCRNYCYQVSRPLDESAMAQAASFLLGTHDFRCFMAMGSTPQKTTVRTIWQADVTRDGEQIRLAIAGDGFLYNMVRIITGTLVEVGLGRRSPQSMADTIASLDRSKAGHTAPPQGLYLQEVFYGDTEASKG